MKISIFLFLLTFMQVLAIDSYSQKTKLSLDMKNATVEDVLNKIENQSEFFFLFSPKMVDVSRKVNIKLEGNKIDDALNQLFNGTEIAYLVMDRQIVLSTREQIAPFITATQQKITITGKVTDEDGNPLPGVNILAKGTIQGTITNVDGNYSIEVDDPEAVLVFSFIGMLTQEIKVGDQTEINITMVQDIIGLEEVVAIGYGTARREDLTGSVTSVDPSETEEISVVNVLQTIHGLVPGLNISQTDEAGETPDIRVRGYSTLSTSASANAPLIVVDGSIYRGSIGDLNPNNIESIDILKGISASAVYGSQASNGVILITTKKGTRGISKPTFSFSQKFSIMTPNEHELKPASKEEYFQKVRDMNWQAGYTEESGYTEEDPDFNLADYFGGIWATKGYDEGLDYDWYSPFMSNGHLSDNNLSVRGRSENLSYFTSIGYINEKGLVKNDEYERVNLRLNLDFKITDWMKLGINSSFASIDQSGVEPRAFSIYAPIIPPKDDNGEYIEQPRGSLVNPYLMLNIDDSDKRLNLLANAYLNLEVPFIQGLSYKFQYSNNYRTRNHSMFDPNIAHAGVGEYRRGLNYADKTIYFNRVMSADNIIMYNRTFYDNHKIDITLLYGVEELIDESTYAGSADFSDPLLGYNKIEAGNPDYYTVDSDKSKETSLYQMARLNYGFRGKYLLTGTIRRDGFSGFGSENKIGVFPSAAFAWIISEEAFFNDNLDWFNFLKLRTSYGVAGRRAISRYQTLARVNRSLDYVFGEGGSAVFGQTITSMPNTNLAWERTTGINLGLDFDLFRSRLSGNFEYYNNNTEDILYDIQIPFMTGHGSIPKNISKVHNWGIELALTGDVIQSGDFNWATTLIFSRDRNEIKELLGTGDLVADKLFVGEPQRVIYDYQIAGIWQLNDVIPSGFNPGHYKIADLNGDGEYTATDDREILGYEDPSYWFTIVNRFDYKRLSLNLTINSIQGGRDYFYGNSEPAKTNHYTRDAFNGPAGLWDYWIPKNPDAEYKAGFFESAYNPAHFSQRNFIRLKDVSLSYNFDPDVIGINLKVYISGQNLITLTDWPGWDAETGWGHQPMAYAFASGEGGRPLMRYYTVGFNVEF